MRIFKIGVNFGKKMIQTWDEDKPARLAAGLAYYSLFSLAPLLFIALTVAGIFVDEVQLTADLLERVALFLGDEAAEIFQSTLVSLDQTARTGNIVTTIISVLALIFAASGLFANLKYAMNTIWQVPPAEYSGLSAFIRTRLIAFLIVIGFGLLLVVVTFLGILLSALESFLGLESVFKLANFGVVFALGVFVCALFYKILPDIHVGWRDVWGGAIFAVILVSIGLWLVVTFLGGVNFSSATQAAGAVAVILIAIYYISQIFLLGAEFTKVYAFTYGTKKGEQPEKFHDPENDTNKDESVIAD